MTSAVLRAVQIERPPVVLNGSPVVFLVILAMDPRCIYSQALAGSSIPSSS